MAHDRRGDRRAYSTALEPMPIGLSGVKYGAPRLVQDITRRLFVSDTERYFDGMRAWQDSEDLAEPWRSRLLQFCAC